jgi:hypothetical protein
MSFRWISLFRRGSWQAFRKFALEEHQDFDRRVGEIDRQVNIIGKVTVFYEKNQNNVPTQKREGVYVKEGTSLHKLCMAYVAHGGNILDISMFLDSSLISQNGEDDPLSQHPLDGLVTPLSGSAGETVFTGNWVGLDKHYYWKVGKAELPQEQTRTISSRIQKIRFSIEKEIKAKRNRIEEKIIKLCDLREQLIKEKMYIEMARGGTSEIEFTNLYNIASIDRILWHNSKDIPINSDPEEPRLYDRTDIDIEGFEQDEGIALRTFYINVFEDAESEKYPYTAL